MAKPRTASAADRDVIDACAAAGLDPPPTVHVLDRLRGGGCLPERHFPEDVQRGLGRGRGTRPGVNPAGYSDQVIAAIRLIDRRKGQGEGVPLRFAPAVLFQRGYPVAEHHLKNSYLAIHDALVEQPLEKASRDSDTTGLDDEDARLDQVDAVAQVAYRRPGGLRRTLRNDVQKSGGSKEDFHGLLSTLFALTSAGHPPQEADESTALMGALGFVNIVGDEAVQAVSDVAELAAPGNVVERLDTMTLAKLEQGREDLTLLIAFVAAVSSAGSAPAIVSAVAAWSADHPAETAVLVPYVALAGWTTERRHAMQQMVDLLSQQKSAVIAPTPPDEDH